jgi:hypothetical protein
MRMKSSTSYATLAALVAALACAGNTARTDDADQSAAARDTSTTGQDTLNGQNENPPGYRGMETDTTQAPTGQTPSDTFLQNQGQGTPQDTAGYSGMERPPDTNGQANQQGQTDTTGFGGDTTGVTGGQDTSGMTGADTTGQTGADTSTSNQSSGNNQSGAQLDSTGMSQTGDTTGYGQSQEGQDSTSR